MKNISLRIIVMGSLLLSLGLSACGTPSKDSADLVISNGKIYTVNEQQPWAEAVAIKGDRIVYVGDLAGSKKFIGEQTQQMNLDGKMLLPGFIDSHSHPIHGGSFINALSLDTFAGIDDWVQATAEYAAAHPDAPLIFGYGFLASTFGPAGPQKGQLDAVVPDRPVLIMDEGFHGAWGNSKALELLNITQDTQDPDPGLSYYKRDANGDATGYFLEATAGMAMDGLNAITADIIIKGVGDVFSIMNSYGITAAFDAGIGGDVSPITVLDALDTQGKMTVRVVGSRMVAEQSEVNDAVTKVEELRGTTAHAKYHYRVLKIMDDGTVEGRTAAMFEDYQGEPGNSGATFFTEEQLVKMITEAAGQQIDVHVHALGERAIHEALNAIEAAQQEFPESASRYTLCHIQLITDQDLPRFAQLGVIAQSTPLWASYDTEGEQFVSADQFSRFWRFESLRKSGARLTFGSDFPASGAGTLGLSPLFNMEVGHTRQWVGQSDAPIQPRESERLGIAELIKGYTINGAYQLHMEDDIGSIEVGKKADLVVLDADPFEVDPYSIAGIRVLRTLLDGETVYEAE